MPIPTNISLDGLYKLVPGLTPKGRAASPVLGNAILGSIQRPFDFSCFFPVLKSAGGEVLDLGNKINNYCEVANFENYNFSRSDTLRAGAFEKFYPGHLSTNTVSFQFLIPSPDIITRYFLNWRSLIVNDQHVYNVGSVYKQPVDIYLKNRAGEATSRYRLTGVFPLNTYKFNMSVDKDVRVYFVVNMRYEKVEITDLPPSISKAAEPKKTLERITTAALRAIRPIKDNFF